MCMSTMSRCTIGIVVDNVCKLSDYAENNGNVQNIWPWSTAVRKVGGSNSKKLQASVHHTPE